MKLSFKSNKDIKPKKTRKLNKSALHFDMFYQLSYMSVIASAGVPRSKIFACAAKTPCASSDYFRKVEIACEQLQYDYSKACQVVGESIKEDEVKGLLLRFSSSLLSGEPEREFLVREAESHAESYHNEYGSKLETLKLWTDAYISLILSAVLVVIVGIVSTMVWKIETSFIVGLVFTSLIVTISGIWLIYVMSPREYKVLSKPGSKEQKLLRKVFPIAAPIAVCCAALLLATKLGLGGALILVGLIAAPVGYISRLDDTKVEKRDSELGAFLRSLGGVTSATGTTVRDAIGRMDLKAIHHLRNEAGLLYRRFLYGIQAKICWLKFVEETGSEVASRSVGMFYDAIEMGGDAEQAGYHASLYANKISMLRDRRKTVTSPFIWLCIAMHTAVVVLLVFISEIITIFGTMVKNASSNMPNMSGSEVSISTFTSFNFSGLEMLHGMVLPLVVVFTVSNAIAPTIADGGSKYKILFNLGITATISGIALLTLPKLAALLFSGIKV